MFRKTCFLAIILVMVISSCAKKEEGFTISGNVEGLADSTVLYLIDSDIERKIDSSIVMNHQFYFKGKLDYPKRVVIKNKFVIYENYIRTSFWGENSNISITGTKKDFKYVNVVGSVTQETANILRNQTMELDRERECLSDSLRTIYHNDGNEEHVKALRLKITSLEKNMEKKRIDFVKEYTNSYASLEIMQYLKNEIPKDTLQKLYDKLTPEFKNSSYAEPIAIYLNANFVDEGDYYSDFETRIVDGNAVKFSDFIKDKYVLLDFFGIGCGPCESFNEYMVKNYEDISKYLEVISYSLDKNVDQIKSTIQRTNMTWNVISDLKGYDGEVPIIYQVSGIPTFFLISPEGKIVKKQVGFSPENFEEILKIVKG